MKTPKIVLNTKFPKPTTTFMHQPKKYSNFPKLLSKLYQSE